MTPESIHDLEKRLWSAADELRANSKLRAHEYSVPVLGLIFLKFADFKFEAAKAEIESGGSSRRTPGPEDYHEKGIVYLTEKARYDYLLNQPEGANIGRALNNAMDDIEKHNDHLQGVLPKTYNQIDNAILVNLLKNFNSIPTDIEGDAFGKIYEYFLDNFASKEGQKGGEFFTPTSIVKLIVEIIEPFHGRIYDPACGSGGMFVQSAKFVEEHRKNGKGASEELSIYGQELRENTINIGQMNLAIHGLEGDIKQGNSYYEDVHNSPGRFDFVMANPPFNVNNIDKERIKDDPRFPYGLPNTDNGNYIWIQIFLSTLNDSGRAGFVMANSASDARHSEMEIRKQIIESGVVDVMIATPTNLFYTVTLPCTLWFFDKGKQALPDVELERADDGIVRVGTRHGVSLQNDGNNQEIPPPRGRNTVLFIDAREIYRQIDRAHRDWTPEQIEFLSNIVRMYRGKEPENLHGGLEQTEEQFPDLAYEDIPGLCKVASNEEIEEQGWSLNPGRYVGVSKRSEDNIDFIARLEELYEELELLNGESRDLEGEISNSISKILKR